MGEDWPWTRVFRRQRQCLIVGFMSRMKLLAVAASLILPLAGCSGSSTQAAHTPQTASTSAASTTRTSLSADSDKGCADITPSTAPATQLPKDVMWDPVGLDSAPRSATAGPMRVSGHLRTCYAHTPTGAAFASMNILLAAAGYDDASVVEHQETDGAGKNESLANQAQQSGSNQMVAYHVDSYDHSHAVVTMVITVSSSLAAVTQPMVWTRGDWYIDGVPTGDSTPQAVIKAVPAGYVRLSPGTSR